MKKLLLINPVGQRSGFLLSKFSTFPPLGLAYVAAATPSHWDIKIIDENFDRFEFEDADFVGITAFTTNVNRAYEIAGIYRDRGIKVVMGGIHASMCPDEAIDYVDSVVVGEVEGIWDQVLQDFEQNQLSRQYIGSQVDLSSSALQPRRDLLHPGYSWQSIQTSRGCPFECDFCSVSKYMGKKYRQRKPIDVLNELECMDNDGFTVFVDDNLIGYSQESKQRAAELFNGMIDRKMNRKWIMQTSINAAVDEKIIELAAKAGCKFVLIGFETLDEETLKSIDKHVNLETGISNYKNAISIFHKYGIAVYGAFIIGNDNESPAFYMSMAKSLIKSGVDIFQICVLTPLPGTKLMSQMQKEGRIMYDNFPLDWDKYRFSHVVHELHGVDPETVYRGNNYLKHKLYSFPIYLLRITKSLYRLRRFYSFYVVVKMNQALKKGWEYSHYRDKYPCTFK